MRARISASDPKYTNAPVAAMRSRVLGSMPMVNGLDPQRGVQGAHPVGDVRKPLRHINRPHATFRFRERIDAHRLYTKFVSRDSKNVVDAQFEYLEVVRQL